MSVPPPALALHSARAAVASLPFLPMSSTDHATGARASWGPWYHAMLFTVGPGKLHGEAIDVDGKVQQLDNDPKVHGHFNQTRVKWRSVTVPERRLPPGPA